MISNENVNIYLCDMDSYIKVGKWENSSYQRSLLMNFKTKIKFKKYKKISFFLFCNNLLTDFELKYRFIYRFNKICIYLKNLLKYKSY